MEGHICPHCGNPVFDEDALLCHFCGESLQRAAAPLGGQGFWAGSVTRTAGSCGIF